MQRFAIPLALCSAVLVGCSGELPTAPADGTFAVGGMTAAPVELPFRGTVEGHETDLVFGPPTYVVRIDATGTATLLGRFTEVSVVSLDVATFAGPEEMTLTAANGDVITATGHAQGSPADDGLTLLSVETMTIVGGTGRFERATGAFVVRRSFNPLTYTSSGSFEGAIRLAR